MSGGKAPKQKPTAAEIQQAQQATARWNERKEDGYLALEQEQVARSSFDHTEYLSARSGADLAKQEKQGLRQIAVTGASGKEVTDFGNTVATADSQRTVDSKKQALDLKDAQRLNTAKVGQDVAATSESGLRNAATLGNQRAENTLANKIRVSNSKTEAVMTAAKGAGTGYSLRQQGFKLGKGGATNEETGQSLNWFELIAGS